VNHNKRVLAAVICTLLALAVFLTRRGSGGDSKPQAPAAPLPRPDTASNRHASSAIGTGIAGPSPERRHVSPLTRDGKAALNRGIAALDSGLSAQATAAFEQAAKTDPGSPFVHDCLGIAYLRTRRFDAAMGQFRQEIRLDPDPSTGWARVADVYYARRNVKEAIRAVERAVALRPDRAQLHFNLGMLYPQALELNKAVESLGRYSALEPNNHYALYLRGDLLYKLARLDDAEQVLNEALRLAPNVGLYHFALAQIHFRRTVSSETTERARAELQKALDNGAPEPAAVYYYLGMCRQRMGNYEEARQALQTSVQMAPEAWGAYYALSEVLRKLGRSEEARKARAKFAVLRAKEDLRMRRSFYSQEVERNPVSADAHYQLAAFLTQQKDRRGAGAALAQASRLAEAQKANAGLRARIAALSAELTRARGR
jgi:tetratricopeptide (TPR) repeat protein